MKCKLTRITAIIITLSLILNIVPLTSFAKDAKPQEITVDQEPQLSKEQKNILKSNQKIEKQVEKQVAPKEEKPGIWDHVSNFFKELLPEKKETGVATLSSTEQIPEELLKALHWNEAGVNLLTENYSRTDVDIETRSMGLPFDISQSYNSKRSIDTDERMLGYYWIFSFDCKANSITNYGGVTTTTFEFPDRPSEYFSGSTYGSEGSTFTNNEVVTTTDQYKYYYKKVITYDANEPMRLYKIEDPYGNVTTINYILNGQLVRISSIVDSANRQYNFVYNSRSFVEKIICPDNRVVNFEYDSKGYLTHIYGDVKEERFYEYDNYPSLTKITTKDGGGNILEEFDLDYCKQTDKFGNIFYVDGNQVSRQGKMTDSNNYKTEKYYSDYGYVTNSFDHYRNQTKATYSEYSHFSWPKTITDQYNNTSTFTRDDRGNITRCTYQDGTYKDFQYNAKNNVTKETDENGNKIFYIYDDTGNKLLKKVSPLNGTDEYSESANQNNFAITEYSYYGDNEIPNCPKKGLIRAEKDPEGRVIVYGYDQWGNTSRIKELNDTFPDISVTFLFDLPGKEITKTYNASGLVTRMVSANGVVTTYTYDTKGNLLTSTVNGTDTTAYTYDYAGRVAKVVTPKNYSGSANDPGTTYTYYPHGKVKTETDALGNTTSYTYDLYGNVLTETKPNGAIISYDYDAISRPLVKYITENGEKKALERYEYDQVLSDSEKTIVTGENLFKNTVTTYDGRATEAKTSKIMNNRRRAICEIKPDNSVVKTEYNPNGTVKKITNPLGYRTLFEYNGLNLETAKRVEVTADTYTQNVKEYDKAGRLTVEKQGVEYTSATGSASTFITQSKQYYKDGKVKLEETVGGKKTAYEYDLDGNLSRKDEYTDDTNKITTTYVNNHQGKPTQIKQDVKNEDIGNATPGTTTGVITNTYDKNGNLLTSTNQEGTVTTNTYDSLNRLTRTEMTGKNEYGQNSPHVKWQTYNNIGKVSQSSDENGNVTTNTYDARGNLIRKTQKNGTQDIVTAFEYDLKNRLIYEVTPENYDQSKQTLAEMNHTAYQYDSMDRLLVKSNKYCASGNTWTEQMANAYQYDLAGNKIKEVTGEAYAAASGNITNAYGTEYTYDGRGLAITMLDAESKVKNLAHTMRYTYDGVGRKIREQNGNGLYCNYTYDANGNILTKSPNNNRSYGYCEERNTYNRMGQKLSVQNANGNTTTYTYNSIGKLKTEVQPGDDTIAQNTITYIYDIMGRVASKTDSMNHKIAYTYDRQGRALTESSQKSDGTSKITVMNAYDKVGNIRFKTDGNGSVSEYTFDSLNRNTALTMTVSGAQRITRQEFDKNGKPTKTINWLGNTSETRYDPLGRVIAKIDAAGKTVQKMEYNKNNVQTKLYTLQSGTTYSQTSYEYDKNNRLVKTTFPEGNTEQKSYTKAGLVATKTDGNGNVTTYNFNTFNRMLSVVNAKNETTSYSYDTYGNRIAQTDGRNNTTKTNYNARNLPIRQIDAGGGDGSSSDPNKTEQYFYNADGTLARKITRNGATISYEYDIHGRKTKESVGSLVTTRTYDGNGNELSMNDSTGLTTRTYDELGRILTKTVPEFGTCHYIYDILLTNGTYAEKTTDPQGNTTTREFNQLGRLSRVRDVEGAVGTSYTYDDAGRQSKVEYENGAREEYTFDQNNRLLTLKNYRGTSLTDQYSYTYDNNGNMLSKNEMAAGTTTQTSYAYDALNRLTYETTGDNSHREFAYDAAGNRSEMTEYNLSTVTQKITYTYDERNRLTQKASTTAGTQSYTYDNNGNMTAEHFGGEAKSYQYNALNKMINSTSSKDPIASNYDYFYNGDGQRVKKVGDNSIIFYLYESDKVLVEKSGDGTYTRNIYGTNLISRWIGKNQSQAVGTNHSVDIRYYEKAYYQYNGQADVTRLSDEAGNTLASYTYDAFGNIKTQSGSVDNPYRYRGYQYDTETGLYYLNARYYNADIARFISEDSYKGDVNDPLSLNLYAYCGNDPIRYVDPTGYSPIAIGIGIAIGLTQIKLAEKIIESKKDELKPSTIIAEHRNKEVVEHEGYVDIFGNQYTTVETLEEIFDGRYDAEDGVIRCQNSYDQNIEIPISIVSNKAGLDGNNYVCISDIMKQDPLQVDYLYNSFDNNNTYVIGRVPVGGIAGDQRSAAKQLAKVDKYALLRVIYKVTGNVNDADGNEKMVTTKDELGITTTMKVTDAIAAGIGVWDNVGDSNLILGVQAVKVDDNYNGSAINVKIDTDNPNESKLNQQKRCHVDGNNVYMWTEGSNYSADGRFIYVVAHEFGHVFGLPDGYAKSVQEDGVYEERAPISKAPEGDIMVVGGLWNNEKGGESAPVITNNHIKMIVDSGNNKWTQRKWSDYGDATIVSAIDRTYMFWVGYYKK